MIVEIKTVEAEVAEEGIRDRRRVGRQDVSKHLLHLLRKPPNGYGLADDDLFAVDDSETTWAVASPVQLQRERVLTLRLKLIALACVLFVTALLIV